MIKNVKIVIIKPLNQSFSNISSLPKITLQICLILHQFNQQCGQFDHSLINSPILINIKQWELKVRQTSLVKKDRFQWLSQTFPTYTAHALDNMLIFTVMKTSVEVSQVLASIGKNDIAFGSRKKVFFAFRPTNF